MKGYINQYDFQGNLLGKITLPGISATAGSCYTPFMLTVDPQGSIYVADTGCQQLLKYSSVGVLLNDVKNLSWSPYFYQPPRGMWTDPASNLYISQQVCNSSGYCPLGVAKLSSSVSLITTMLADYIGDCMQLEASYEKATPADHDQAITMLAVLFRLAIALNEEDANETKNGLDA